MVTPALLVLLSVAAGVQETRELEAGVVYEGGTRLVVTEYGISLTVPAEWRAQLPFGSELLVMEPKAGGVSLFAAAQRQSPGQIEAMMKTVIDLGSGFRLQPTGQVTSNGDLVSADYRVIGSAQDVSGSIVARVSEHGVAAVFALLGSPDAIGEFAPVLRTLAEEAAISTPKVAAVAGSAADSDAGERDQQTWLDYLRGKYIARYYTTTGYTDETHLWLCSDGSFQRSASSGGFGGGASGAFHGGSSGTWSAEGKGASGTLVLRYTNGQTARHDLAWDYQTNKLFLDDKNWLHGRNEKCR